MSNNQKKCFYHCLVAVILSLVICYNVNALPVVPNLYGFGTETRAAYGAQNPPEICIVDSLGENTGNPSWDSDSYSVGVFKGTLIQCIEGLNTLDGETIDGHDVVANSGKIILFEVSGTITENASADAVSTFRYDLDSYTSIYGQTSPDPGILLRNISIHGGGQNDILIQHLRGRMDGPPTTKYGSHKSFSFNGIGTDNTYNIVVDHVSAAWGEDGQLSLWNGSSGTYQNFTIANSILSEARENMGLTDEEAYHGKSVNISGATDVLLYGNLLSNSRVRNPKVANSSALIVNNYSYNNSDLAYACVGDRDAVTCSFVGNVLDGGPMSGRYASEKMPNFYFSDWVEPLTQHHVYLCDNKTDLGTQSASTDWLSPGFAVDFRTGRGGLEDPTNIYIDTIVDKTDYIKVTGEKPSSDSPIWPTGLTAMPSSDVKAYIITNAGAYPAFRDSIDARLIDEMKNDKGPSSTVKGAPTFDDWPNLATHKIKLAIPANPHADDDGNGYTNLEEWLHRQAAIVEGKAYEKPKVTINLTPPIGFRKLL